MSKNRLFRPALVASVALSLVATTAVHAAAQDRTDLVSPEPQAAGRFGYTVAFGDDTLFVGAPGETTSGASREGVLWAYERGPSGWEVGQRIASPVAAPETSFGRSVDCDRDLLVVGACPTDATESIGSAHVFRRIDGAWQFEQTLTSATATRRFGSTIAVQDGDVFVGDFLDGPGEVVIYRRVDGVWTEIQRLSEIPGTPRTGLTSTSPVGLAVTMDVEGRTLAVGAYLARKVAIYRKDAAGTWRHLQNISVGCNQFGRNVELSGDRLAVTCPVELRRGEVFLYRRVDGRYQRETSFNQSGVSGYALVGYSLALEGESVWSGAVFKTRDTGRGLAFNYRLADGSWGRTSDVRPVNNGSAEFAFHVDDMDMGGGQLAVGASGDDDAAVDAGRVSVFADAGGGPPAPEIDAFGTSTLGFGVDVDLAFEMLGGTGAPRFEVVAGDLPPGISLDADTGALKGLGTTPGTYAFDVEVTDGNSATARKSFSLDVIEQPVTDTNELPLAIVGRPYRFDLSATASGGMVSWFIVDGELPEGLSLDATTGRISGVPHGTGSRSLTWVAEDAIGSRSDPVTLSLRVAPVTSISRARRRDSVNAADEPGVVVLELLRGTRLDVLIRGSSLDGVNAELRASDGSLVDLADVLRRRRNGLRIRGLDVPATDRYTLELSGPAGGVELDVRTSVRAVRRLRGTLDLAPGELMEVRVPGLPGARLVVSAAPRRGEDVIPAVRTVVDAVGRPVLDPTDVAFRGRGVVARAAVPLDGGGELSVWFEPQTSAGGRVTWRARVRSPGVYTLSLPALTAGK